MTFLQFSKYLLIRSIETSYGLKFSFKSKPTLDFQKEFKKIGIICTKPLGLGDLVMDLPFISSLRKGFPKSKIHLITDKDMFETYLDVDQIKLLEGSNMNMLKQCKKLRSEKYDLILIPNRAVNQVTLAQKLRSRFTLGYISGWNISANFKIKSSKFLKDEHYWNMSQKIGDILGLKRINQLPEIKYSSKIVKSAKSKLKTRGTKIFVNPGVLWESRRWNEQNYVDLIEKLHKKFKFVLYGGPGDIELCTRIKNKLAKKNIIIESIAGKLNLKEAISILKNANLFLTSDAGPMHFAFLMKTPTLALFGPVNPQFRLPKENKGKFDSVWFNDYEKCKLYNYEYETYDKHLNGLEAIPVKDVEKKILNYFKDGGFK